MIAWALASVLLVTLDHPASITFRDGSVKKIAIKRIVDGKVLLTTDDQKIAIKNLERIEFSSQTIEPLPESKFKVRAVSNTTIRADAFKLIGAKLELLSPKQELLATLPRSLIQSIQFDSNLDETSWKGAVEKEASGDRLVVNRNGRLDLIEGIIKSLNSESVEFETQGRIATVKIERLAGITFFQRQRKNNNRRFKLTDRFGNQFVASSISILDSDVLLGIDEDELIKLPVNSVKLIDFSSGRIVYLDSLKPTSQLWKPFFQAKIADAELAKLIKLTQQKRVAWTSKQAFGYPLTVDETAKRTDDNPVGRRVYKHGLAIRGGSRIDFAIPPKANKFLAEVGIQSNRRQVGSVILEITVDGQMAFDKKISYGDGRVKTVEVPCKGRQISISVLYGDQSEVGDIAVLGNARFELEE